MKDKISIIRTINRLEDECRDLTSKDTYTKHDDEQVEGKLLQVKRLKEELAEIEALEAADQAEARTSTTGNSFSYESTSLAGHKATVYADVRVKRDSVDKLKVGHLLRAALFHPTNDAEKRALLKTNTGAYMVPSVIFDGIIDQLRAKSIPGQAGVEIIRLDSPAGSYSIPKILTDSTFEWKAEAAELSLSDVTLGTVSLTPKTARAILKFSREEAADSIGLPEMLEKQFIGGLVKKINDAFLFGATNGPAGIEDLSGLTLTYAYNSSFGAQTVTDQSAYFPVLKCLGELLNANVPNDPKISVIINPEIYAELMGLIEATTGNPLRMPRMLEELNWIVNADNTLSTTPGARTSKIFIGQGNEAIMGIRNELTIQALTELYATTYEVGALAAARLDFAHRHNASWAVITGVNQDSAFS